MTIAGHDCNAYCRPDEGLHCETDTIYNRGGVWWSIEEWVTANSPDTNVSVGPNGVEYPVVDLRPAPEAEPEPLAKVNAELLTYGMAPYAPTDPLLGVVLMTFRAPVEAPI